MYNLRDHMKRVHAWKEPIEEIPEVPKKSGRKRKSSASKAGPSQRRKPGQTAPAGALNLDDFPEDFWTGSYDAGPSQGFNNYGYGQF